MKVGGDRSYIYIHGIGHTEFKWYRVQFLTTDLVNKPCGGPAEMPQEEISSVATLCQSTHGSAGSWDVIGDDIYWVGGFKYRRGIGITLCNDLLRHKVNDHVADPSSWEVVSSSIRLPRKSRFLAAVGTKKLCVVGGEDYRHHLSCSSDDDDSWRHCGEIYDLEENTWTYLPADYKLFSDYDTSKEVAVVVENDDVGGEEPTRIVFYSCKTGSTLFLDLPSGEVNSPITDAKIKMWQDPSNEFGPDVDNLLSVSDFVRPVFTNNTFYWLTPQLQLLGYDIVDQAWLLSPSLEGILLSLFDRPYPIVVGLQEGRLLAVISPAPGELTVASLTVTRPGNCLSVSVDLVQHLFLDDDSFMPLDGKAIHGAHHLPEGESLPQGGQCSLQSLSLVAIQQDIGFLSEIDLEKDESKVLSVESSEYSKLKILLEENEVIGFDGEADTVLGRLFKGTTDLEVIPVVGMPGLGKTTLASKIYKDPRTLYEFFWHIWVNVGQSYGQKEVLVSILEEFVRTTTAEYGDLKEFTRTTTAEYGYMTVNELAKKIRDFISKRGRCLIVLDDVWATDVIDYVMTVFPENRKGHRIMITTRKGNIGRYANANPHSLKFLTDEESFQLLESRIFRSNTRRCPEELVPHGKSIAKQCSGVPLAVVVIAGALKGSTDQKEWKIVEEKVGQHLIKEDKPQSWLKFFKICIDHLPEDMKACFLYCGAFSQGYEIPAWKLIRLWISQGLINSKLNASPEYIAVQYLNDLVNRNLVMVMQKKADDQVKTCCLHDMLLELCLVEVNSGRLFQEVCEKPDRTGLDIPDPDSSRQLGLRVEGSYPS